jgi:serine protease Do
MNKGFWSAAGGTAALCAVLIAAPGYTAGHPQQEVTVDGPAVRDFNFAFGDEGGSWLGVETGEVNGEKAKELRLPAERGALIGKVAPDSPASKGGLKENDVVTEINGQHVEGALQFRRMIRETPTGRNVQLTVWRDGHNETLNVTLGKAEDGPQVFSRTVRRGAGPGAFAFRIPEIPSVEVPDMPDMPEVMEIPDMPSVDRNGNVMYLGRPRLGIDAEDLNGQLGTFFGAPEGEGILVRSVNSGSPAEKAGLQAGDVITSVNGERIHSVGDLRQKLSVSREREKKEDRDKDKDRKEQPVKLGLLRNKSEMSINVELPAPAAGRTTRVITHKTNI